MPSRHQRAATSPNSSRTFTMCGLMWLKIPPAPDLLAGLEKIEKEQAVDQKLLRASLEASGKAIETLLGKGFADGKIKGFKTARGGVPGFI